MQPKALDLWHQCVVTRSAAPLETLLADEVVFHSPVVHTPQQGKRLVTFYLAGALQVLGNETFRYTREVVQGQHAVLEFETVVEGITINGVDMISWNDDDRIVDFKVMIRPLKAIELVHRRMGEMLARLKAVT